MIGTIKILPPEVNGKTPPEGYGPLVHSPSGLEMLAKGLLGESEGVRALFKADGYGYLARLEQHPPAPERGFSNWHKGVTVYEASENPGHPWGSLLFLLLTAGAFGYLT